MIGTEVQKAIHDALMAAPAVAGGRIYDRVPDKPTFPYITIGDEQILDDGNSCDDGWEVFHDLHAWSRSVGFPEVKGLIAAAVPRLASIASIGGHTLIAAEVQATRVFRDPDGLTNHGVITVRFVITPV
ncbi:DUF3168 domain-containing protein [Rhizobium sp. KVB221]|uniref:DUF3168 domain-containing protein n=1 Tax=Rhizobium setariae TaxID=2801340 RepID=A0A937CQ63_9HYPH|nr:DUF3168 domain-containing protein [Rhizobium setariae]MBL0374034.1 DUF3168 domain-containing protein [Rhizobium setariae]